jgi:hypothetical protein
MQIDETTPKYVGYVENIQKETKTTERKRISKVDAKPNTNANIVRYQTK